MKCTLSRTWVCRAAVMLALCAGCSQGPESEGADGARPPDLRGEVVMPPDLLVVGPVAHETGSLIERIEGESVAMGSGQFRLPTAAELASFRQAFGLLLDGQGERAAALLLGLGYGVTDLVDDRFTPTRQRRVYVVQERAQGRRYQGTFVVRRDPHPVRGALYLEAPYGRDQSVDYVQKQAVRAFLDADVGGLLLNTADRCAEGNVDGRCGVCSGGACVRCAGADRFFYPQSDVGRVEGTFFQAAHEVIMGRAGTVALSLHGVLSSMARPGRPDNLVSDGTRRAGGDGAAGRFLSAWAAVLADAKLGAAALCDARDQNNHDLCGETLVQGRSSNQAALCGAAPVALTGSGRFLVVQQSFNVRMFDGGTGAGEPNALSMGLRMAWR